jgi:hypothetical protein
VRHGSIAIVAVFCGKIQKLNACANWPDAYTIISIVLLKFQGELTAPADDHPEISCLPLSLQPQ